MTIADGLTVTSVTLPPERGVVRVLDLPPIDSANPALEIENKCSAAVAVRFGERGAPPAFDGSSFNVAPLTTLLVPDAASTARYAALCGGGPQGGSVTFTRRPL